MGRGIFHIFNAVTAENEWPIGFGIGVVLVENLLIDAYRLVEFVVAAEMVCSVIEICPAVIIQLGQSLVRTAILADRDGFIVDFHCTAAHFAFEYRHIAASQILLF